MESAADPRVEIQTSLEAASNYNRWIGDQARAVVGGRVLDAGCGSGNITSQLLDRDQVVAVDVWDDFVATMAERFGHAPNLAVHQFDLADPEMTEALLQYDLDSAICANVLEHVEDHRAALSNIAGALRPGSPIFLLVPAFMLLYGEHDRADHHFRRYTKRMLRDTVAPLPLEIESSRYMNLPGFFAWLLLVRLMRRTLDESKIGLYDRVIPGIRWVEERIRPPFGQTLVAVLRTTR
ncbi:MAG TPA: class I SAM-dependent methyltransferase [Thermoleophilaceae bacterium]|nr:class I SAM-dependent methyltransferase [Thermoleophilaceae bacterium]